MEGVDLLLIPPGLVPRRCEESLAALRGKRERMGVPVLKLSSAVKEGFLHDEEVRVVPWPIQIEGLAREITDAYKQFEEHGAQYLDAESGIKAAAYRFDERVLLVYEESETGLVVLIQRSAWKGNSPKP